MGSPFRGKNEGLGNGLGRGQDSVVMELRSDPENWVVKFNHDREEGISDLAQYLSRKYEILKTFIPQHIPKSYFVIGNKDDGTVRKEKVYTIQERIHGVRMSELSPDELLSSNFYENLASLVHGLYVMHNEINLINTGLPPESRLDVNLDLGGLSKKARFTDALEQIELTSKIKNSPNILVDRETLQLYCIDFGRGTWNDSKEYVYQALFQGGHAYNASEMIEHL